MEGLNSARELIEQYGNHFIVEASNIGWRNLSGSTSCFLEEGHLDEFVGCISGYKWGNYSIEFRLKEDHIEATITSHDSPTGEGRRIIPGWYCQGCGEVQYNDTPKAKLQGDTFCTDCAFDLTHKCISDDIASHLWQLYEIQINRRLVNRWPDNAILEVAKSNESLYDLIRYNLKPGIEYPWLTEEQMWEVFNMGIEKFCDDRPREFYPIHDMTYVLHEDHIYIVAETIDVNDRRYYLR